MEEVDINGGEKNWIDRVHRNARILRYLNGKLSMLIFSKIHGSKVAS